MKKSTLLHLRIPFSFFLMPVFLLALAVAESINETHAILSFFLLHFLVYPASNGYNSYFDRDEGSIGGLKNPPPVDKQLYWVSLALDIIALLLGLLISVEFVVMVLIYGLVSKAYSHPLVRLKKYPILGWLAAGIFQGYVTFLLCYMAICDVSFFDTFRYEIQLPGILSSILLLGSYPMTQVYQHDEDAKRGDLTISQKLGVRDTFHFTAMVFLIASVGFFYYFHFVHPGKAGWFFLAAMLPVVGYFGWWYMRVRQDLSAANYDNTMKLNFISSLMLNGLFFLLAVS